MLAPALLLALVLVPALGAAGDDVLPAALDALLLQTHVPGTDTPFLLDAGVVASVGGLGQGRCLADLGDVTGDGAPDFAVGCAPGTGPATLEARDGRTGKHLWAASVSGGGFRTPRVLVAAGTRLYAGVSGDGGRVSCHDVATGALRWTAALGGRKAFANILALALCEDRTDDGLPELLVAGGAGLATVMLLSGADGARLWASDLPGGAGDVVPVSDVTGDGVADVAVAGGDSSALLLSGSDGVLLWSAPLEGPGTVVLALDDIDGDGLGDLACGQFAAPLPGVVALSAATGHRLWVASDVRHDVTSLALLDDLNGTGVRDVLVGSFDNAVSAVLALNGLTEWRTEASTVNGGALPVAVPTTDINGDGVRDVYAVSVDRHAYVIGGRGGGFIAKADVGVMLASVLALGDGDGDGRPEILAAGNRVVAVLDGDAGTASGPVLDIVDPPETLRQETYYVVWAYPATGLLVFAALGTARTPVPGFGTFGLELASLVTVHAGGAPGAGVSGLQLPPCPHSIAGSDVYLQAATIYSEGLGALSEVAHFQLP